MLGLGGENKVGDEGIFTSYSLPAYKEKKNKKEKNMLVKKYIYMLVICVSLFC